MRVYYALIIYIYISRCAWSARKVQVPRTEPPVLYAHRSISMVNVTCPNDGCGYETGDVADLIAAALLNAHTAGSHAQNNVGLPVQPRRTPKIDRPVLKDNITEEMWNAFAQSWTIFLQGNDIPEAEKTLQLYSACDMALKAKITALCPDILNLPVNEVLDLLKKITVTPVATTVKRNELLQLTQDAGEKIRTFFSRVKGKTITCGLRKECTHPHRAGTGQADPPQHVYIDFTDDWIRHVILNGLMTTRYVERSSG